MNESPVIGVAVDRDRMVAGLVAPDGEVLVRDRVSTPTRDWWRALEGLVGRVMAAIPAGTAAPTAVGVSCIGPVDQASGSVNPTGWRGGRSTPLASKLYELVSLPAYLAPTAVATAEAIRLWGDAERTNFVVVHLDATVESACVVRDRHLFGAHGNAGSIAHVLVDPGGLACSCGAAGCASPYLSATAIEQELARPRRRAGPGVAERTGIMLGRALASLLALVDVEIVYVTGHVLDQCDPLLVEAARRELDIRSRLSNLERAVIVELDFPPAPLVAAAAVAIGRVVEPVEHPPDPPATHR
jgi:glucokinase